MNPSRTFLKNLIPWSFYIPICAAPAFLIASQNNFNTWSAGIGMALGAITYIVLFAALDTFCPDHGKPRRILRIMHWTVRVRAVIALVSLIPGFNFLAYPDLFAGMLAINSLDHLQAGAWLPFAGSVGVYSFEITYLITMTGGFYVILTIALLMPAVYAFVTGCFQPMTKIQAENPGV